MDKQGLVPTHNMIWGDDNSAGSLTKEQIDKVSPIFPLHNMLILNRGWRSPVHDDRIKYGKIALAHPHVKGLMMEACPEAIAGRAGALFVTDVLAANKLAVFLMSPGPKVLSEGKGTYLDQIKRLIAYFEESGADIGSPDVVFSLAIYARQDHPEVSGFIDGATPIKHSLDFLMAHPLHSK